MEVPNRLSKAQYKLRHANESWATIGSYGSESEAISVAVRIKAAGALIVRVLDKNGRAVFSN